jgi:DNA-binding NarL/FixJ family response regulator
MTNLSQLKKAIKIVISGELWLERKKLENIVSAKNDVFSHKKPYLNETELEIVKMICNGHSNKEIKKTLKISEQSVKSHLSRIYKKARVSDRLQLALFFINTNQAMSIKCYSK